MISDNERREVARRLRAVAKKLGPNMDVHEFANYTADVLDVDERLTWYEMELRLADLIEPPTQCPFYHSDRHYCSAYDDVVDRDALLRIADDMDAYTECDDERCGKEMPPSVIHDYARRIREALGVES